MIKKINFSNYRIVVTGATGFLGRHLMPILQELARPSNLIGLSSKNYDLIDHNQVKKMFAELKPEILIHLAGYSGGIGANNKFPADFYFRNTLLTALVFQEAANSGIKKLIYPMGGCSYPGKAKSPIDEQQMWEGFPQMESAGYSSAKKMSIVASMTYRKQYNLNSTIIIPGNMYGEYDNFSMEDSHVIPAQVRKFYEAKLRGDENVTLWGSGAPARDFVYAGDVANAILWFIENFNETGPVNISSGTTTSIKELAETVSELSGFKGKIVWDTSKPDGQMVKIFDVKYLKSLGLSCNTQLRDGLQKTINWFIKNYSKKTDGIRL